jgi:hypothetical protein
MEQAKPWTAIIPLNEEYYIAFNEKQSNHPLILTRLKSRKYQQDGFPTLLPSKPWEKYTSKEITTLYIDFDKTQAEHQTFNLQEQAKRDRERGLKAVFIDSLTLRVPWTQDGKTTQHDVEFALQQTPKLSETRKAIQEHLRNLRDRYGLYQNISKKDKTFFERVFQRPSCLEICHTQQFPLSGSNTELLGGTTEKSIEFLCNLAVQTGNLVWDAYKKFDTHSGFILDGVVSSQLIEERLKKIGV